MILSVACFTFVSLKHKFESQDVFIRPKHSLLLKTHVEILDNQPMTDQFFQTCNSVLAQPETNRSLADKVIISQLTISPEEKSDPRYSFWR